MDRDRTKKIDERDIEKVLELAGLSKKKGLLKIMNTWGKIAGEGISTHTKISDLTDDKVLIIEVNEHTWLTELRFMSEDLIRKIKEQCAVELKGIKFKPANF